MLRLFFASIFITLLLTFSVLGSGRIKDTAGVAYLRITFYQGVENEGKALELINYIENKFGKNSSAYPILELAYYGAAETLLGKHAFNPYSKLSHLNSGLKKLSDAIQKSPRSLEIRFMRFSVLHYIPFFLGWGSERDDDAEMIYALLMEKNFQEVDKKTQLGIANFLIESKRLNDKKSAELRQLSGKI